MYPKDSYSLLFKQLWLLKPDKHHLMNNGVREANVVPVASMMSPLNLVNKTDLSPVASIVQSSSIAKEFNQVAKPLALDVKKLEFNQRVPQSLSVSLIDNWDELVSRISNCTKCSLCDGRKNVVIERGVRSSSWMFVGEGPGEQEDIQGKPFVGASGQLLDKMLTAMQLNSQTDVYICNVVKCRPPYNRNPEESEIMACNNYLLSQISLVKPKIIVALGRFASQTLLNSDLATGKLRNQVHKLDGIPVIVTYHPSYLLRNPSAKKAAWDDLQLAMKTMEGLCK